MNEVNEFIESNKELEKKYLIFKIKDDKYAFSIKNIKEIITKPKVYHVPNLPDFYLGLTKLRNDIVPIISLRKRLQYNSLDDENNALIEMLKQRENDHVEWLKELENSIRQGSNFALQRDHRLCKFGEWYYSYKPDSFVLYSHLKKFEDPHKNIHSIANHALEVQKESGSDAALAIIERTRDFELKKMLNLFQGLYKIIENNSRETTIVFYQNNGKQIGFVVDQIDKIIEILPENIELPDENNPFSEYLSGIGKVGEDFYLIFNEEKLT